MNTETEDEVARLRVPPHSIDAEQSVLGALLLDNQAWDRVADMLNTTDFYRHEHQLIYETIGSLVNACKPADAITVFERLQGRPEYEQDGGLKYLADLVQSVPSALAARRYAEIVRERALRRSMIAIADEIATAGFTLAEDLNEQINRAAERFAVLNARQVKQAPQDITALVTRAVDRYTDFQMGERTTAISTGIPPLDRVLNGGLRGGKTYGVAARPSVGKSSLARSIGLHVAGEGVPTLLLSQEMPGDEVADCVIAQFGGIPSDRLQSGRLSDEDWGRLTEAVEHAARLPFFVDDQGALTLPDIRNKARSIKGCGCIILDYLQLSASTLKNATRNDQVGEISRGLKSLAMSLNIPIIVLSQLSRAVESRSDREPQLTDLRDSGEIEQDLDVAVMLWTVREFDNGARRIVGCKVPKHRGGQKGRFALEFKAATYRWYESDASIDPPTHTERRGGFE